MSCSIKYKHLLCFIFLTVMFFSIGCTSEKPNKIYGIGDDGDENLRLQLRMEITKNNRLMAHLKFTNKGEKPIMIRTKLFVGGLPRDVVIYANYFDPREENFFKSTKLLELNQAYIKGQKDLVKTQPLEYAILHPGFSLSLSKEIPDFYKPIKEGDINDFTKHGYYRFYFIYVCPQCNDDSNHKWGERQSKLSLYLPPHTSHASELQSNGIVFTRSSRGIWKIFEEKPDEFSLWGDSGTDRRKRGALQEEAEEAERRKKKLEEEKAEKCTEKE